jgi:hypothetical protein
MITSGLATMVFDAALQGMAAGVVVFARLYAEPSVAVWLWPLTAVVLLTGGSSAKRRRRYRYR